MQCAEALPRLQAEEALHDAAVFAVGSGSLKREDSQRLTRQWEDQARGAEPRRRPTRQEYQRQLAGMGLQLVES